jgi:DnaK suppressor protein
MEAFRNQLLELRAALTEAEATGAAAEEVVELDQTRQGRLSRMDAMQAQAMSKATGAKRRQLLRDIEAALQRFDDGTYGECFECGEPIAPGRLRANPTATLCIGCAEALESGR